jgi:putative ABC transport system permease protein
MIVMLEAAILGVLGAVLGVFAGVWLARGLLAILGGYFSDTGALINVSWQSMVKSFAIGMGVTLLSAMIPASLAANISPLEALRARSRTSRRLPPLLWLSGLTMLIAGYAGIYYLKWREQVLVPAGSTAIFMLMLGAVLILPLLVPILERSSRWLTVLLYGKEGIIGHPTCSARLTARPSRWLA